MAKKAIQILTVDNFIGIAENKNYNSLKKLKTEHIFIALFSLFGIKSSMKNKNEVLKVGLL